MCDTFVVVGEDEVWLAKNSDREPGEAQGVEHHPRARPRSRTLDATHITIDQADETFEVALSRPSWMWGAEMGANEHGVAIGNEAVFTRVPVEERGLLGMDLVRIALERAATADEALERITWMLARHGQGGRAGFRHRGFTYHNAFMIADRRGAWLLETAGRFWAALRLGPGARSTSNVLTIGAEYTRLGAGTIEGARSLGLLARGETFDFRRVFGAPLMGWLSGGDVRRACTTHALSAARPSFASLAAALRDHAGLVPAAGARLVMPCAHASWLPTRGAGQTTATMVSRLGREAAHVFTGTSAPCLSVLKPVPLGSGALLDPGPRPSAHGWDGDSLFWRAERLHRAVLRDYDARRASFEDERRALEERALAGLGDSARASSIWAEHRERVLLWTERARAVRPSRRRPAFDAFWRVQSWRDGIPA